MLNQDQIFKITITKKPRNKKQLLHIIQNDFKIDFILKFKRLILINFVNNHLRLLLISVFLSSKNLAVFVGRKHVEEHYEA